MQKLEPPPFRPLVGLAFKSDEGSDRGSVGDNLPQPEPSRPTDKKRHHTIPNPGMVFLFGIPYLSDLTLRCHNNVVSPELSRCAGSRCVNNLNLNSLRTLLLACARPFRCSNPAAARAHFQGSFLVASFTSSAHSLRPLRLSLSHGRPHAISSA